MTEAGVTKERRGDTVGLAWYCRDCISPREHNAPAPL